MQTRKSIAILLIAITLTACESCNKANVTPLPETPFTKASRAADDIASALKLLTAAESNLEQQKIISRDEGLTIINALGKVYSANAQFINDIEAAKASNSKSAAVASGKALIAAAQGLVGLSIKNPEAQKTFATVTATINIALGILQSFIEQ